MTFQAGSSIILLDLFLQGEQIMQKINTYLDAAESYYIYKVKTNLLQLRKSAEDDNFNDFLSIFKQYKDSISSLNLIQQMKSNTQDFLKDKEDEQQNNKV